jgi:hypothetical protein
MQLLYHVPRFDSLDNISSSDLRHTTATIMHFVRMSLTSLSESSIGDSMLTKNKRKSYTFNDSKIVFVRFLGEMQMAGTRYFNISQCIRPEDGGSKFPPKFASFTPNYTTSDL